MDEGSTDRCFRAMRLLALRICVVVGAGGAAGLADAADGQPAPPFTPTPVTVTTKIAKARPAVEPVDLRSGPQLFMDDHLIAKSDGVDKVTQHPQRFLGRPVLGWEQHTTQPYVTVLRDPQSGKFRMWYNHGAGKDCAIAYAESDDGVQWTAPRLDLVGPDNRLFIIGRSAEHGSYGVSVIDDGPNAVDPQKRYKLTWWSGVTEPAGVSVAWSPDGLHWTPYEKNPVLPYYPTDDHRAALGTGDIVDLFYDPIRRHYSALFKLHAIKADGWSAGPRAGTAFRRLVGQSHSDDFLNWTIPWRVMIPEPRDEGQLEFYSSGGTIARGPVLITFIRMLHDDYSPEPGMLDDHGKTTGIGYTTLATSRDGEHWERHDDIFFDRAPEKDAWDHAMTWVGSSLPVGDELYLYYGGYQRGHKIEPTKERQIGLVKMTMDRFIAREARGEKPCTLLTAPLAVRAGNGSRFVVNADASRGRIRVQVREMTGQVIPGYSFDDCAPISGDGIRLPVEWTTNVNGEMQPGIIDLARLNDQTVRLEFEITNAKLFAFELEPGEPIAIRVSR